MADPFRGPNKILTAGFAVTAGVASFAAFGWIGGGVFVGVMGVLLIVALWSESGRLTGELTARDERIGDLESECERKGLEIDELEPNVSRVTELQREIAARDDKVRDLMVELRQPTVTNESLLENVGALINAIDLARKHAAIDGETEWPIVRVELHDEDAVLVLGFYSEGDPARLAQEPVTWIDADGDAVGPGQVVSGSGTEIAARFDLAGLPPAYADELHDSGTVVPQGHRVELAGLNLFPGTGEDGLNELRGACVALTEKIKALMRGAAEIKETPQLPSGESQA